ncbi:sigma-70 family RNA polymerase sigma factor [Niveispirillum irakense]|uniref:sigma-70 family RNA polymerase sigma factor n=1 Tax=Niveispirillum irakense TaxID=34011 RepID=UPI0013766376|nr:sigma-70 family RNA polymerase sigma factor [Niveispirillum irakense]
MKACLPVPPELKSILLYKDHRAALVDYANGIVRNRARAEDVVQDAWERLQAVERGQPLTEPLRYFYRIVRNLALDGQRAWKREILRSGGEIGDLAEMVADDNPTAEAGMAAREELHIVLSSLEELPERSRLALHLHTIEGLKLREVAERLGLSVSFTHQLIAEAKLHCIKRLSGRP